MLKNENGLKDQKDLKDQKSEQRTGSSITPSSKSTMGNSKNENLRDKEPTVERGKTGVPGADSSRDKSGINQVPRK